MPRPASESRNKITVPDDIKAFADKADGGLKKANPQRKRAEGSKTINVYFTKEQHELIKTVAENEERSIQKQIIFSIMRDIETHYE